MEPGKTCGTNEHWTYVGGVERDEQTPTLRPSPEMGQHTEEVPLEHGLSWEDIAAHKASGAIL